MSALKYLKKENAELPSEECPFCEGKGKLGDDHFGDRRPDCPACNATGKRSTPGSKGEWEYFLNRLKIEKDDDKLTVTLGGDDAYLGFLDELSFLLRWFFHVTPPEGFDWAYIPEDIAMIDCEEEKEIAISEIRIIESKWQLKFIMVIIHKDERRMGSISAGWTVASREDYIEAVEPYSMMMGFDDEDEDEVEIVPHANSQFVQFPSLIVDAMSDEKGVWFVDESGNTPSYGLEELKVA